MVLSASSETEAHRRIWNEERSDNLAPARCRTACSNHLVRPRGSKRLGLCPTISYPTSIPLLIAFSPVSHPVQRIQLAYLSPAIQHLSIHPTPGNEGQRRLSSAAPLKTARESARLGLEGETRERGRARPRPVTNPPLPSPPPPPPPSVASKRGAPERAGSARRVALKPLPTRGPTYPRTCHDARRGARPTRRGAARRRADAGEGGGGGVPGGPDVCGPPRLPLGPGEREGERERE